MSTVEANGIRIAYDRRGQGPSLVMIAGIGYGAWVFEKQLPAFTPHFDTIAFDNRGVGDSDKPDEPYSIDLFAQDTLGLMDALDIERAHVLGVSQGGMVALQMALDAPDRVARLILGATTHGGPNIDYPDMEVIQFLGQRSGTPEERFQKGLELSFSDAFRRSNPPELERLRDQLRDRRQPDDAYNRQAMAPITFNAEPRLGEIIHPALVITGSADRVVPPANSERLAEKLPNAQLEILNGAGHLCFIERAETFNQTAIQFLLKGAS
ncbi:MAG: alpha/beta fold hydrolase [Candidatus Bipolaricaulia bacterium]